MNKKIWLTLGTTSAVIAPLATVIACSSKDYSYSEADFKILAELEKASTKQKLETQWMSMVLKENYGNKAINLNTFISNTTEFKADFVEILKFTLTEYLRKNPSYFVALLSKIAQNDKGIKPNDKEHSGSEANKAARALNWDVSVNTVAKVDTYMTALDADKIAKIFFDIQKVTTAVSASAPGAATVVHAQKVGDIIFNPAALDMKTKILKLMIAKNYLKITRKEYQETFATSFINNPDGLKHTTRNETKYYPLLKETLQAKLAFMWQYNLAESETAQFVKPGSTKMTFADIKANTFITDIESSLKLSEQNSVMPKGVSNVSDVLSVPTGARKGYAGIRRVAGGVGTLSTLAGHLKKQKEQRFGWMFESQIVTEHKEGDSGVVNDKEVTVIKANKLSMTYAQMILPTYHVIQKAVTAVAATTGTPAVDAKAEIGELQFGADITTGTANATTISYKTAINTLLLSKPGIYDEAVKYYTTRKLENKTTKILEDNHILLVIHNVKIRDILVEKGYSFIDKKKN